jgi:hypothetical protein
VGWIKREQLGNIDSLKDAGSGHAWAGIFMREGGNFLPLNGKSAALLAQCCCYLDTVSRKVAIKVFK